MQKITTLEELKDAIAHLEKKKEDQALLMKQEFRNTFESLKPINILKGTLREFTESQEIKGNLVNTGLGMAAGYLSKKLMVGDSSNLFKKMTGSFLQMVVSKLVAKKSEAIKQAASNVIKKIFRKDGQPQEA